MKKIILSILLLPAAAFFLGAADAPKVEPGRLIFPHKFHVVDNEIDCATCHEAATTSKSGTDRMIPGMEVCANCHDVEKEDQCSKCHSDPNNIVPAPHSNKNYDAFSHEKHIGKLACKECHAKEAGLVDKGSNYPDMKGCYTCHTSNQIAPACGGCHLQSVAKPVSHIIGWKKDHSIDARFDPTDCAMCHQAPGAKTDCRTCHVGLVQGAPHPGKFDHSKAYTRGGGLVECQTCHEPESFCAPCHVSQNVMPANHNSATWRTPSTSPSKGGLHAKKAEADIESCVICHTALNRQPSCSASGCHQ